MNRSGNALLALLVLLASSARAPCAAPEAVATPMFLEPAAAVARVFELENTRLALMPSVAAAKWRTHAPVEDPERERVVIERAVARGGALGLGPDGVRALFALQIRLARELEVRLAAHWAHDGADAPPAGDLEGDLRPRIDRLTTELLQAIYLARPALEEAPLTPRYAELAAAALSDASWSVESRAALLAALGQLRRAPTPALARMSAAGIMRIGTTGDYAPYSLELQGHLEGADIELGKTLAARLGLRPVFVRTRWGSLLEDLGAERFDVALGGISVTRAREAVAMFSRPYASTGKTILARCAERTRYASLAAVDRPGVRVVVNPGGTNQEFDVAHLHRATLLVHADNRSIFDELLAGRADVMITDDVEVELAVRGAPALCRTLRGTLTQADKAVLLPRDAALRARIDGLLDAEVAAGAPARWRAEFLRRAAVAAGRPQS